MKIITWNVNGIRAVERKGALQDLIEKQEPDILFLQEIKGKKEQFSKYLTDSTKYRQFYHSAEKPGYAGTGIWIKYELLRDARRIKFNMHVPQPTDSYVENDELFKGVEENIGIYMTDLPNSDEGRVSHLSFLYKGKIYDLASIYFPNGGKSEQAWEDKLIFFDKVLDYMNGLRKLGHEVIIGGDMNVAHEEIDLARSKENDGKIGFHPRERAWMDKVMESNWVDVWRYKNPNIQSVYSWWDMKTRARDRNVGWRIDYFFMDRESVDNVQDVKYLGDHIGSDHCPLMMEI
ncbi:MAG: exodeoxyribonuclease III [Candidatus Moraniibacteriota bacterium]|jgi:exodeoxyribonuclease III